MQTQKNGKISLEAEISSSVKMAIQLKQVVDNRLFFQDMRFGLDFESKSTFVEIRPRAFFLLFNGRLKTFMKKFRQVAKTRFLSTEKKLCKIWKEPRVKEIIKYCNNYFKQHDELFLWHRTRH